MTDRLREAPHGPDQDPCPGFSAAEGTPGRIERITTAKYAKTDRDAGAWIETVQWKRHHQAAIVDNNTDVDPGGKA